MEQRKIAIIGAGAVGAYYGGRLAQAGHDVSFFTRSDAEALRTSGLHVSSIAGDFNLPSVQVFDDTAAMPPADWIIVCLKATAIDAYVDLVRPLVRENSAIICLQNGLGNEDVFADAFGANRVFGAIAYTCINRTSPGRILHTAHGLIRIGEFALHDTSRAESIAAAFQAANVPAEAVSDLKYYRWEKLVWNIPFNGWGTALNLHTAQLLSTPAGEALVRETMAEVIRAAAAVGVNLPTSHIDFEINRTRVMGDYHSSMQLDRQHGRALETEAIICKPLALAAAAGVTDLARLATLLECLKALAV